MPQASASQMNPTKINPNIQSQQPQSNAYIPPADEIDSRNEIFTKSGTDPVLQERKPLSNLQTHLDKHPTTAPKSKNMYAKINRGISPNQPPSSKQHQELKQ